MSSIDTTETDAGFTFQINGTTYDFLDLSLGDIEELEDYAGEAWSAIDYSRAGILARVAWYFLRQADPSLTLEAVRRRPLSMLRTVEPEESPTPPVASKKAAATA